MISPLFLVRRMTSGQVRWREVKRCQRMAIPRIVLCGRAQVVLLRQRA